MLVLPLKSVAAAVAVDEAAAREVTFPLWHRVLAAVYVLGVLLLWTRLTLSLLRTLRLRRRCRLTTGEQAVLASHPAITAPYSLFHTVYLPEGLDEAERAQVLAHEESHVRHRHSYERLALEVLKVLCWFNPFVWLALVRLTEVQEQEADADVLRQGFDVASYRTTLLKQVLGIQGAWACNLVSHPLKRRFLAMTAVRRVQNLRIFLLLPLLLAALFCFGFTTRPDQVTYEVGTPGKTIRATKVVTPDETAAEERTVPAPQEEKTTGTPLVLLNDKPYTGTLNDIDPERIEAVLIVRQAEQLEVYKEKHGEQAANGVILITLKP